MLSFLGGESFAAVPVDPAPYGATPPRRKPNDFPLIASAVQACQGESVYATETSWQGGTRMTGYAFRGDGRGPADIMRSGGFVPSVAADRGCEPDWTTMHLDRHQRHPDSSGYVSFTRSPLFALRFANYRVTATNEPRVYAALIVGGFDMTRGGGLASYKMEQEIVIAGGLDWENVVAYRSVKERVIYVRQGFDRLDPEACREIRYGLSAEM